MSRQLLTQSVGRVAEAAAQFDWPWKIAATIRRPCYGPSSARDLKVLAGNCLPFAARYRFFIDVQTKARTVW
jgi:hypothetical protein